MVGAPNTGKGGILLHWEASIERRARRRQSINRAPQQVESLIKLIRDLHKRYPGAKAVGHRDLAPTQWERPR